MIEYTWNEQLCRTYADGLRGMVRFDHRPWARRLAPYLVGLPDGATVMDVAAGPGFLLLEVARHLRSPKLIAQDASPEMLRIAEEEARGAGVPIATLPCPAERLDMADASVDVVTCKQLLHEAGDLERTIAEIARVLKPGGRAFLIDFDADGSRLSACLIRAFLRIARGREIAGNYWRSYSAGLPGARVRDLVLLAGLSRVEYQRSGPNYLVTGKKPGPLEAQNDSAPAGSK